LTGPSLNTVIGIIIITSIPVYARVVRTQTQALRNQDFILAERAMGASTLRILQHHVLPNIAAPMFILASMDVPAVVGMEAGLSFLGLGVSPPTPSWGSILNDGYSYLRNSPWPIIAGGLPLIAVTLGFTFFGESLRDIFDPKLRNKGKG
jgi:peptide/nickel transport system permease protein